MPSIETIFSSTSTAPIPSEPDMMAAVTTAVAARVTEATLSAAVMYLKRLPAEYELKTMVDILARHPNLITHRAASEFLKLHTDLVLG